MDATEEVDPGSGVEQIRHETYLDVLKSPYLRRLFAIRNTDMERLAGIAPNRSEFMAGPTAPSLATRSIPSCCWRP